MGTLQCDRCEGSFHIRADHTKIVRRDFREQPRPATVEHLCAECWHAYVEEFLGEPFDEKPLPGAADDG